MEIKSMPENYTFNALNLNLDKEINDNLPNHEYAYTFGCGHIIWYEIENTEYEIREKIDESNLTPSGNPISDLLILRGCPFCHFCEIDHVIDDLKVEVHGLTVLPHLFNVTGYTAKESIKWRLREINKYENMKKNASFYLSILSGDSGVEYTND